MPGIEIELNIDDRGTPKLRQLQQTSNRVFDRVGAAARSAGQKMKRAFDRAVAGVGSAFRGLGRIARRAFLPVAAAVAGVVAGFTALILKVSQTGDEFAKMARRTGVAAGDLSKFAFFAERSGTDIASLENGLRRLQRNMLDASRGLGEATRGFDALGIKVKDAQGNFRPTVEVLTDIAKGLAGVESEAERAGIAQELLGRAGTQLLPLLEAMGISLDEMTEKFKRFGAEVTPEAALASEAFRDSLTDLKLAFQGVGRTIGFEIIPALTPYVLKIADTIAAHRDLIKTKVTDFLVAIIDKLPTLVNWLGKSVQGVLFLAEAFQSLKVIGQVVFEGLLRGVEFVVTGLSKIPLVGKQFEGAAEAIKGVREIATDVRNEFISDLQATNNLRQKVGELTDQAQAFARQQVDKIIPALQGHGQAAEQAAKGQDKLKDSINQTKLDLKGMADLFDALDFESTFLEALDPQVEHAFIEGMKNIGNEAESTAKKIKNVFEVNAEAVKSLQERIDALSPAMSNAKSSAEQWADSVLDGSLAAKLLADAESELSQAIGQTNQQLNGRPILVDRSVAAMERQIERIRSAMALNQELRKNSPFLFPPMAHRGRYDPERQMRESLARYQQALRTARINEAGTRGRAFASAAAKPVNLTFNIQGVMSDDERRRLVRETVLPELRRAGIRGGANITVS